MNRDVYIFLVYEGEGFKKANNQKNIFYKQNKKIRKKGEKE